jgi:hypothetical protein
MSFCDSCGTGMCQKCLVTKGGCCDDWY